MSKLNNKLLGKIFNKLKKHWVLSTVFGLVILFLSLTIFCFYYFNDKIYPRVYINDVKVGGLKKDAAFNLISSKFVSPEKITLTNNGPRLEINLAEIELMYNHKKTVEAAFSINRTSSSLLSLNFLLSLFKDKIIQPEYSFSYDRLNEFLSIISNQIETQPEYPSAKLVNNKIEIKAGMPGSTINNEKLLSDLNKAFATVNFEDVEIELLVNNPSINEAQKVDFQNRAERLIGKNIILLFEFQKFEYPDSKLIEVTNPYTQGIDQLSFEVLFSELEQSIKRDPQNASFVFQNGKVEEFTPAKDGVAVDKKELLDRFTISYNLLSENESNSTQEVQIPVSRVPPEITTDRVNNLGIKELLGRGTSNFAHSIPSRVFNINHASSKFNGVLVPPGEIFSFNNTLGDVSSLTGYKQAYVIRDGRTVLGDGGGVCQVSTTLFRAILNTGLPVIERRAHSYRVSYYEQGSPPGLDATVFAPSTDLKFKNDTPGHLLIQTEININTNFLAFEIYGTSDGRKSNISKPVTLSVSSPPEDLYIDDANLPSGKIEQIDYKAWGAKVSFDYSVERNGEIIYEKTFFSNYQPWQAKFLKGTGPAVTN